MTTLEKRKTPRSIKFAKIQSPPAQLRDGLCVFIPFIDTATCQRDGAVPLALGWVCWVRTCCAVCVSYLSKKQRVWPTYSRSPMMDTPKNLTTITRYGMVHPNPITRGEGRKDTCMDHALRCMVWDPAIVVHSTPIRHRDQPHSKQEGESRERGV